MIQNMENDSKYYVLNKCFKDFQHQVKAGNTFESLQNQIR